MKKLFFFVFLVLNILLMTTGAMAQENGWENLTWGMSKEEVNTALECKQGMLSPTETSEKAYNLILTHHLGSDYHQNYESHKLQRYYCAYAYGHETYDKIVGENNNILFFKGKFIAVANNLNHGHFSEDTAYQKSVMNKLKSEHPSGTITAVKFPETSFYKGKYLAFEYKSADAEIFNDNQVLIMISTQGFQPIFDGYNDIINKNKSDKEKRIKIF